VRMSGVEIVNGLDDPIGIAETETAARRREMIEVRMIDCVIIPNWIGLRRMKNRYLKAGYYLNFGAKSYSI